METKNKIKSEVKFSDCDKCHIKIKHIWQCWKLYDGNTCPSFDTLIHPEELDKKIKG